MGWFLLGLLIYFLVLLAENALVAISQQEIEQLRMDASSGSARRAISLTREIRPVMAALLLARILLKLLLVVFPATGLLQSATVQTGLFEFARQSGLPEKLVWLTAGLAVTSILALIFWAFKRINIRKYIAGRAAPVLERLSFFIIFWKSLFKPFIKAPEPAKSKDNHSETDENSSTPSSLASEKREIELLKSIVKFGDVTVKQVMQPRSKVVAVDFRIGFHELLATVREAGFSRLPVYQEDLDNVTGVLYVKDLLQHLDKSDDFEWQSLIRTNVMLAPESKRCTELLTEFKRQKIHMAIVVDEYGGSAGIVTLEDILEEVTGEIRDEFDEESDIRFRKLDDFNYLFEGQTILNDVCRIIGLDPDTFDAVRGNADTLAGLVLELKGDIPKTGAEIVWNGYLITVIAANSRRIEQLKLTLPRL